VVEVDDLVEVVTIHQPPDIFSPEDPHSEVQPHFGPRASCFRRVPRIVSAADAAFLIERHRLLVIVEVLSPPPAVHLGLDLDLP
jgi:hypothetical protein